MCVIAPAFGRSTRVPVSARSFLLFTIRIPGCGTFSREPLSRNGLWYLNLWLLLVVGSLLLIKRIHLLLLISHLRVKLLVLRLNLPDLLVQARIIISATCRQRTGLSLFGKLGRPLRGLFRLFRLFRLLSHFCLFRFPFLVRFIPFAIALRLVPRHGLHIRLAGFGLRLLPGKRKSQNIGQTRNPTKLVGLALRRFFVNLDRIVARFDWNVFGF